MKQRNNTRILACGILILFVVCAASLFVGTYPLSFAEILKLLSGQNPGGMAETVFWTLRFPRVLTGLLAGMALGMAGAVFQLLFGNPLASPDMVGVASGAGVGTAVAVVLGSGSVFGMTCGSFLGGMLALLAVFLLVKLAGNSRPGLLILAGIIISSFANALLMFLKYAADSEGKIAAIEFWTMGSLASVTASKSLPMAAVVIPSLLVLFLLHKEIIMLGLKDEQAKQLGLNPRRMRMLVLLFATLAVAAVISVTGVIAYIGLLAPHTAFLLLGRRNRSYLFGSGVAGGIMVVVADCLARSLVPGELPISILTIGCTIPFLLFLLWRRKGGLL